MPPSAQVVVVVNDFAKLHDHVAAASGESLFPLLTGRAYTTAGLDPQSVVKTFLGPTCRVELSDLRNVRFAVAARSWEELADGVLFIELPDDKALDRWFPDAAGRAARISRDARMLRLDEATLVIRDKVLAASRSNAPDTLMRETMRLMAGRLRGPMLNTPEYQRLLAYLPAQAVVTAFLSKPGAQPPAPPDPVADNGSDAAEVQNLIKRTHTIIGAYVRDGRLEVAIRGTRDLGVEPESLDPATLQRVASLPRSSLLAWATSLGTLGLDGEEASTAWSRYLRLLLSLSNAEPSSEQLPPRDSDVIVVWDEAPATKAQALELGLLVRCRAPRELNDQFGRLVQRLLLRLNDIDPVEPDAAPAVTIADHSGSLVSTLSFRQYASRSSLPGARLLADLDPSWGAAGDWWMLTLSRAHLERLLDAAAGKLPSLSGLPEFQGAFDQQLKRVSLLVTRPAAASHLLDRWIQSARAGGMSLLNPRTLSGTLLFQVIQPDRLGIGMQAEQEPGTVVVARVYPETAADGLLEPGDRIIGIDGRLLSLATPNLDLRTRWQHTRSVKRTMRIIREGVLMDVPLEFEAEQVPLPDLPRSLLDTLTEASHLAQGVSHAAMAEHHVGVGDYAALLSITLAPPRSAEVTVASPDDPPTR